MSAGRQAVFDCNVFLQAMLNIRGAAHACWQKAVTGEVKLYVSAYILAEIRSLVDHRDLRRFRQLSVEKIERFIEEIIDVSTLVDLLLLLNFSTSAIPTMPITSIWQSPLNRCWWSPMIETC
jgi:predicted nucleic acid-binding protein